MGALQLVTALLRQLLQSRAALAAENLALRHQIVILQRSVKRPRLHRRDRIFWVWLSRLWRGWRSSLIVVQPETVLRWHREGFRLYWRWKSRRRCAAAFQNILNLRRCNCNALFLNPGCESPVIPSRTNKENTQATPDQGILPHDGPESGAVHQCLSVVMVLIKSGPATRLSDAETGYLAASG